MKYFVRGSIPGAALAIAIAAAPLAAWAVDAGATGKPIRHLVYSFTYSYSSERTQHDSGIGGPVSGMASSRTGSTDRGEITADVMQVARDGGLVIAISEKANETRSAAAVNCAVYGSTNVICDPTKKVNEEELSLLRLLGAKFINTDQIDEKNHWRMESTSPTLDRSADFTIERNDNGVLTITEARSEKQKGAQGFTAAVNGKITYNLTKNVPTAVTEATTTRQSLGMGDYDTADTQVSLNLETDSLGGR